MHSTGQRAVIALTMVGLVLLGAAPLRRFTRGMSLVSRAASLHAANHLGTDPMALSRGERLVTIVTADGRFNARVYAPRRRSVQTALLIPGLHPAGIADPRFVALARELARSGVTVATPEIPELSRFEITPALTDRIEQAAVWLANDSGLAPTGQIGMMGISFSGGLAVVAAGRPALRNRVAYVFAFGGHDDLPRVLRYLCLGTNGKVATAQRDYGVAVVLLNVADHVVPPEQVDPLRDAVRRFLRASYLDRWDRARADREFAALRALERDLPPPSSTLLGELNGRACTGLGPLLLPHLETHAGSAALSPARSSAPAAPVFLLHGRDDDVIPASESVLLATRLRGRVPVRLLVTDLLSHADVGQARDAAKVFRLAWFWGEILDQ